MIFPLFNERHAIAALVRRVPPSIAETIVVDDGSDDGGPDLAREAGARVISQERRRGVGAAIRTGIEAARANGHGAVVVLAANGKDDPAEAPRLIDKLRAGYDPLSPALRLSRDRRHKRVPRVPAFVARRSADPHRSGMAGSLRARVLRALEGDQARVSRHRGRRLEDLPQGWRELLQDPASAGLVEHRQADASALARRAALSAPGSSRAIAMPPSARAPQKYTSATMRSTLIADTEY